MTRGGDAASHGIPKYQLDGVTSLVPLSPNTSGELPNDASADRSRRALSMISQQEREH